MSEQITEGLRLFAVHVDGYTGEQFTARSASAARYVAYKAFCEANQWLSFRDFLSRVSVTSLGGHADH